jgi:hydrogenase/urease accessory protein HupE
VKRRLCVGLLVLCGVTATAHEVRPAFLRIADVAPTAGPDHFEILWRVPEGGELQLTIYVILPAHCETRGEPLVWSDAGVRATKWISHCRGGLNGHEVSIGDLSASVTDVLARYERADGTVQVVRLTPTSANFTLSESESWYQVSLTYSVLGVEHILLGIDHLLFVLALLMIVSSWRKLVATITSFTLAHSITLAAATLGLVSVPQAPVEAVIALSILFVATEIVHWRQGRPGITRQWPWIVAFVFGLLHGFGFAGALSEIGLPAHAIPLALLFFNIGVEAGQLFFIAAVLGAWEVLKRLQWAEWAWRVPVYAIGSLAAFWTIERITQFAS